MSDARPDLSVERNSRPGARTRADGLWSAVALRWLLLGILMMTAGKVLVTALAAREKVRYIVWLGGTAILVNIVANLALIPYMDFGSSPRS